MNYSYPTQSPTQVSTLAVEKRRQHLVEAAISFKNGMNIEVAPSHRHVLSQFALGRLTIDEVVYYLEALVSPEATKR
jgi:hypothetical protein